MKGNYKFAGFPVVIESIYEFVHKQCSDYTYDGSMDDAIYIKTTQKDIEDERKRTVDNDLIEKSSDGNYSDDHLESLAIYRRFCDIIYTHDCLMLHGCAVSAYGRVYLFTADSGVGKSTHAKLWLDYFGSRAEIINGNNPILRIENDNVYVYGTPWCGREGLNKNKSIPLQAICILRRGEKNYINEISDTDAYAEILRQCYNASTQKNIFNIRTSLGKLMKMVRFYTLNCNTEPSAAIVAYEGMKASNVIL